MNGQLNKGSIERYSRQIVLKDIGIVGQKKISNAKVLVVGAGGLGSPVTEFLSRAGIGSLGIVDDDRVSLCFHGQTNLLMNANLDSGR